MARPKKIQLDTQNANLGTERGRQLLAESLQQTGAGRSILVDKHGRVIAGNKTYTAWTDLHKATEVVHTDGSTLVVVQRDDLDLDDPYGLARKLAYYDNRVSELDLDWDVQQIWEDVQDGIDLSNFWDEEELDQLLESLQIQPTTTFPPLPTGGKSPFEQMTFTLATSQADVVREALKCAQQANTWDLETNANSNGNALAYICGVFLRDRQTS